MDQRLRRWMPRLLLFSVLGVLLAVGVLQHQWFSRAAAVEIENALRGLQSGVRQSVFRELQRYAPLVASARQFQSRSSSSERQYRVFADELWSAYGTGGTAPDLLSGIGVRFPDQATFVVGESNESVVELRPMRPDAPALLLFLDLKGFFSTYARPALDEVIPGATFAWKTIKREPGERETPEFDAAAYSFNPLSVLAGGTAVPHAFVVSSPRLLGPSNPELRIGSAWAIEITLPPDAPILSIEQRLAWNWLSAVVLLAVVAAAFALALGQWSRLAELRRREREFVASVSHELRTPLTVIRSAADNFNRGIVPTERQNRYGRLILDQAVRLGRMIEEMITFAQTEAAPPVVQDVVNFEDWLRRLRPPLEAVAAESGVALIWETEPLSGSTDADALRTILENLVVNAINHAYPGDKGAVRVALRQRSGRLEISVEDDGRGIAAAEARKVFEPFYRDQFSRSHQEKGSGLGLFLSMRQAKRLRGSLKLESPWRRGGTRHPGCRFVLDVPLNGDGHGR